MSEIQKQQEIDQKNYQFRIRLEQFQEDQLAIRKEQHYIEEQQEEFFQLQQQEQAAYDFVLGNCDPEERSFFEERGDDSLHLAKKAQREFDEQLLQLKKDERSLFDQEEKLKAEQHAFWKKSEEKENGA
ncbi:hypothetical protein A5821_000260 [Enterococcus sp. 7F3_DIV0205]|uniref:Uncharacterized protein n=1 Tax=Candidatus Enterococcus palustris TaxID=1834189 RepID=A0AAQ3Y606_9ENTE|nr:hypothetical protein [Enterococcus sp. 7F3_DIV0205]OTN84666.1 hypothetical protein A5821_000595 [Enterococcus sp. 7F3_DIV0205]